jgi:hypothetical protein
MAGWRPAEADHGRSRRAAGGVRTSRPDRNRHWLAVVLAGLLLLPPPASAAPEFAAPAFQRVWQRTEQPVAEGRVSRPYLWGPAPLAAQTERYDEGREGRRLVQYFDKGRLELTQPDNPAADLALLQDGALVRDLVLGLVQVGSNRVQFFDPAFIPVAGDDGPGENDAAPRYADFALEVVNGIVRSGGPPPASGVGQPVTATIQAGVRDVRPADAEPRALIGAYDPTSGHNIAAPFWEAFAAAGLVIDPVTGADQQAPLYDWRLLAGAPLTEPAWTTVSIGGQPTLLLVQLFERRVLTYRPDAPAGWQVEMANTGRHYYQWRYGPAPAAIPRVGIAPAARGRATQRLSAPPLTPATPYQVETWLPPSVNGAVTPGVGPGGVRHQLLARGFRTIDFINDDVSAWLTTPGGRAVSLNDAQRSPVTVADETAEGVILIADTSQLGAGVWALTLQSFTRPEKQAVLYFRVTAAPRELPLVLVLNPLFWLGLAGEPPSAVLERARQEDDR